MIYTIFTLGNNRSQHVVIGCIMLPIYENSTHDTVVRKLMDHPRNMLGQIHGSRNRAEYEKAEETSATIYLRLWINLPRSQQTFCVEHEVLATKTEDKPPTTTYFQSGRLFCNRRYYATIIHKHTARIITVYV